MTVIVTHLSQSPSIVTVHTLASEGLGLLVAFSYLLPITEELGDVLDMQIRKQGQEPKFQKSFSMTQPGQCPSKGLSHDPLQALASLDDKQVSLSHSTFTKTNETSQFRAFLILG